MTDDEAPLAESADGATRKRRLWALAAVAAVVVVAAAAIGLIAWNPWNGGAAADASAAEPVSATAIVEKMDLAAQLDVDATLGYAETYKVVNQSTGILTSQPSPGDTVSFDEVLYEVDGEPVVLLQGATPAWRTIEWGTTGADAKQLNAALVSLGYADGLDIDPNSDTITWRNQQAIKRFQAAHGLDETGTLTLGQVAFLPEPARVTSFEAPVGSLVSSGHPVMSASSTRQQVKVPLDVAYQDRVSVGDAVIITLPNRNTATGIVTEVGKVATSADESKATIEVLIDPEDPGQLGGFDQAPVQVAITTSVQDDALVVPIAALLARPGGGYAVDVVHDDGSRELIDVKLGLIDTGNSRVAVTGEGLAPGQKVVVP